jgi:hypothetical protein
LKSWALGIVFLAVFATISMLLPSAKSSDPMTVRIEKLTSNTFDDCRPSVFVDSFGKVHIAWTGGPNFWSDLAIYYAYKSATGWEIEQVPKVPNSRVNMNPSLFIDSRGRPHIAWISNPYSGGIPYGWDVWYAVKDGDTWVMEQITHWEADIHYVKLFLDSSDNPHLAWDARYYYGLWGVHYATKIGGTWTIETVDNADDATPSLFVDSSGIPHMLWCHIHSGLFEPGYGVKMGGGWIIETIQGLPGSSLSSGERQLYVDQYGQPHIAISREISPSHGELYYGKKTGGSWSFSHIQDSWMNWNMIPSVFLDSAGIPYVAWVTNGAENSDIYVAIMQEENWYVVNVSETTINEYWPSLFVDASSHVHLAWHSPDEGLGEAEVYYAMVSLAPIAATIDINPDTLNLKSKGKWITAYIELPEGYDVADINVSSILLNGTVPAELRPTAIGDYNSDGIPDLMVKFDRQATVNLILQNCDLTGMFGTATLTVTGNLNDGTLFMGSDTIKIVMPMPKGMPKGTFDR